jgi:hypothetical protein
VRKTGTYKECSESRTSLTLLADSEESQQSEKDRSLISELFNLLISFLSRNSERI